MKVKFTILNEDGSTNEDGMKEVLHLIRLHGREHHYHVVIRNGMLELSGVHVETLEDRDAFLNRHVNDTFLDDRTWKIKTSNDDRWGIPVFAHESRENLPKGSEDYEKAVAVGLIHE